ncbi:hypothetical protein SSX86_005816 [Deinandra increscens subsp. villosa]|uniref:Uncharacterized protein n=1 Tax=Deinandra increscens subsp. villosa TaxID=3103831 RepID=A0AAP0DM90_9ASTR
MHSTKIATVARPGNGRLLGRFFSTPPPEGGSEGAVGEKAKQTMDNVLGAAKDTSEKLKERVMGTGTKTTAKPSRDPEQNHGVESTDSSCEDVRGRPGGYS